MELLLIIEIFRLGYRNRDLSRDFCPNGWGLNTLAIRRLDRYGKVVHRCSSLYRNAENSYPYPVSAVGRKYPLSDESTINLISIPYLFTTGEPIMSKFAITLSALLMTTSVMPAVAEVPTTKIAQASNERAPIGTYTATMGTTTVSRGVVTGTTARSVRRSAPATQGVKVSINITSYSSQEELNTISKAGENKVIPTLATYNHGTITIAGKSQPINLAVSFRRGNTYRINILTAKPYSAVGSQGGSIAGNAYGAITLVIPIVDGASGTGTLFTMVGSRISNFADEILSGGATATTTPLQGVKLN
jgi:hypothetical protein